MVVAHIGKTIHIEEGSRIEGGVEDHTCIAAPVAVDILRPCDTGTRSLVERDLVADSIARGVQACPCGDRALIALGIVVVEDTQVLSERGLQARVTLTDVQWVAIVGDIEQVVHRRLTGVGIILHTQLTHLRAFPAEVECRCDIGNRTCGIGMMSLIILQEV